MDSETLPVKETAIAVADIGTDAREQRLVPSTSPVPISQPAQISQTSVEVLPQQSTTETGDPDGEVQTTEPGHLQPENSPTHGDGAQQPTLSKNQQKKLKRKQQWEEQRASWKARKKENKIEKRARQRAAKAEQAQRSPKSTDKPAAKQKTAVMVPVNILIDCDFDDLMSDKELVSLAAQVTRCYSENMHAPYRSHLAVSSFGGRLKTRFDTVLEGLYRAWKHVHFCEGDFVAVAEESKGRMADPRTGGKIAGALVQSAALAGAQDRQQLNKGPETNGNDPTGETEVLDAEVEGAREAEAAPSTRSTAQPELRRGPAEEAPPAEPGEVVYLTGDSPHTLARLQPHGTYIVGGLVDRNRHKGLCYQRAAARGVRTAKLPIADYMDLEGRRVLATNHVVEILLAWLESGDWRVALEKVMPKRKGARLKAEPRAEEGPDDGGEDGEGGHGYDVVGSETAVAS